MKTCEKCGTVQPDEDRFCLKCGALFSDAVPKIETNANESPAAPVKDNPVSGILFANKYTLTKAVLNEYTKALTFKSRDIVLGVFLILSGLLFINTAAFVWSIIFFIVGLFPLTLNPFLHKLITNRRYKQSLLFNNGTEPWKTTELSGRIHTLSSNKAETFFDYSQITHIKETKNLIILNVTRLVCIIIKKDGFTVGTLPEFRVFIRTKCPGAKYKY